MPHRASHWLITLALALGAVAGPVAPRAHAQADGLGGEPMDPFGGFGQLTVRLEWRESPLAPGATHHLGVVFDVIPLWHIQAGAGSGDELPGTLPTELSLTLPPGWTAGDTLWPEAHTFSVGEGDFALQAAGYEGRTLAVIPVTIPADAAHGSHDVSLKVSYQACDDKTCAIPTDTSATGIAEVSAGAAVGNAEFASLFEATLARHAAGQPRSIDGGGTGEATRDGASPGAPLASKGLHALMGLAFVGGFLLNLTPCVLPVIPLKIMGLSQSAGSRGKTLALGIVMAAGVVAFWMALGGAIVSISGFTSANQLFQYPWFSVSIGLVIAILSIGMCGLFSIQLPRWVYAVNVSHDSMLGSFLFGIMTAILSTPCTAPFMGSAAAAAVGQSTAVVLSVFGAIGVGMASPYLVLAGFPHLARKMPRTGPANELIKQVMGLLMLAAAAYFVGVGVSGWMVEPPAPPSRAYFWVVAAFVIAAGAWLAYRTARITSSGTRRAAFAGIGFVLALAGVFGATRLTQPDVVPWVYYTPERLAAARSDGRVVVVEFTAEWCLNCKLLERSVLNTKQIAGRLSESDVVPIKVDLTGNNAAGNELLRQTGSVTIPWLVIYSPDGDVVFAQNWYTADTLIEALERAKTDQIASR
jgi:thiol:disulfide interchange protein